MVFACNVSLTKSKGDKQLFWRNKVYKKGTLVGTFYKEKSNEQKINRNVSSLVKSSDERESARRVFRKLSFTRALRGCGTHTD